MDGYSISQVAERTGFSRSALRFYEQHGLVQPDRTPSGFRSYDDLHVEQLGFIGRAKGFGLSPDEITDLLALLDEDRCSPVQDRLRTLIAAKIDDAECRVTELVAFAAELRRVASTLGPAPAGPCDGTCGCVTDSGLVDVAQGTRPDVAMPIACTLAPDQLDQRTSEWDALAAMSTQRIRTLDGVRVQFPRTIDVAGLAALVAAEQECCRFFSFTLGVADAGITLEIAGPPEASALLAALIGDER
jgi:DNA-binding transcriptional MerR regulator